MTIRTWAFPTKIVNYITVPFNFLKFLVSALTTRTSLARLLLLVTAHGVGVWGSASAGDIPHQACRAGVPKCGKLQLKVGNTSRLVARGSRQVSCPAGGS